MRKDDFMPSDLNTSRNNTIWMRKTDFVSYRIRGESECKDARSGETGLSSRAREPILIIRTRLDFRPHFFLRVEHTLPHRVDKKRKKNTIHFFFFPSFISTESYIWIRVYLHAFPQVLTTARGPATSHRD